PMLFMPLPRRALPSGPKVTIIRIRRAVFRWRLLEDFMLCEAGVWAGWVCNLRKRNGRKFQKILAKNLLPLLFYVISERSRRTITSRTRLLRISSLAGESYIWAAGLRQPCPRWAG